MSDAPSEVRERTVDRPILFWMPLDIVGAESRVDTVVRFDRTAHGTVRRLEHRLGRVGTNDGAVRRLQCWLARVSARRRVVRRGHRVACDERRCKVQGARASCAGLSTVRVARRVCARARPQASSARWDAQRNSASSICVDQWRSRKSPLRGAELRGRCSVGRRAICVYIGRLGRRDYA